MKLKDEFITYETDGEQIMVAAGPNSFSGLVRSNRTAAFIVDCLKNPISKEKLVNAVLEEYDAAEDVVRKDIDRILEKLKSIGALEE